MGTRVRSAGNAKVWTVGPQLGGWKMSEDFKIDMSTEIEKLSFPKGLDVVDN